MTTTATIRLHPDNSREEIERFLNRTCCGWNSRQKQAWLEFCYDPNFLAVLEKEGQIAALLPFHPLDFTISGRRCLLYQAEPALYDRNVSVKEREELLDAFTALSDCNVLLCACFADGKEAERRKGYVPALTYHEYTLTRAGFKEGSERLVFRYEGKEDLYAVYRQFLSVFSGYCLLPYAGFQKLLHYARRTGRKISCSRREDGRLNGFCIWKAEGQSAQIEWMVYLDSSAFCSLLKDLLMRHTSVRVILSDCEKASRFLENAQCTTSFSWMIRCTQPDLFSQFSQLTVKNTADLCALPTFVPWMGIPLNS